MPDWDGLRDRLANALHDFGKVNAKFGQVAAIHAVTTFLLEAGVDPRLLTPLVSAVSEASDTDGKKPLHEAQQWACAAAFVDVLVERGTELSTALKEIETASRGTIRMPALKEFRKNVRRNRVRPEARAYYDRTKADLHDLGSANPAMVHDAILNAAKQILVGGLKE